MSRFRPIDRATDFLLPPSIQEWLPEAHLARYVVEVVEQLGLSALERAYAGHGSYAYPPVLSLSLLIYGHATGTFSSRKIERATHDSLAFRCIACNLHPDHDTLAHFRRRFGAEFQAAFVRVLQVARGEPTDAAWRGQFGWCRGSRQRQPAQRLVLRSRRENRSPAQGRSGGAAAPGGRGGPPVRPPGGTEPAGGSPAAADAVDGHCRGQSQDRSPCSGTL